MPSVKYKQKCSKCKDNFVVVTWRNKYAVCYDCQKAQMDKEIKDPKMKKLFDIPEEFYKKNTFLRDIKIKYLEYEKLSEKQIEVFKKVVKQMEEEAAKPEEEIKIEENVW